MLKNAWAQIPFHQRPQLLMDVLMVTLAVASAGLLVFEVAAELTAEQVRFVHEADLGIALFFLADFLIRFVRAEKKVTFVRKHWYDLLSAIPITETVAEALHSLRIIRVVEVIHVLRFIRLFARLHRIIEVGKSLSVDLRLSYLISTIVGGILLGAIGIFFFEQGRNETVKTFGDALWLSVTTATTIGYGDVLPKTVGGKIIVSFLTITTIFLVGSTGAIITNYLLGVRSQETRPQGTRPQDPPQESQ